MRILVAEDDTATRLVLEAAVTRLPRLAHKRLEASEPKPCWCTEGGSPQ
jgi:hypothetical protein